MFLLAITFGMGATLSAASLLAMWLVLGRQRLMRRVIAAVFGLSFLGLLLCTLIGEFEVEWLGLTWIVGIGTANMFLFMTTSLATSFAVCGIDNQLKEKHTACLIWLHAGRREGFARGSRLLVWQIGWAWPTAPSPG